jgi:hypothetical protein
MQLTQLERQFQPFALIRGGVYLLAAPEAIRFIERCDRTGVAIEGIEGFKVIGERIQPFQEHSHDFKGKRKACHAIAKAFIQDRLDADLWFEVVTSDRSG